MDIADWHDLMRDKHAEKEEREHRLWKWVLGLSASFPLVILLVYLWYAG